MEIYLFIVGIWNIIAPIFSLVTTFILLKKYPDRVHGIGVILWFGMFLSIFSILFYIAIIFLHLPTVVISFVTRPLIGFLSAFCGLVSTSQLIRISRSNKRNM